MTNGIKIPTREDSIRALDASRTWGHRPDWSHHEFIGLDMRGARFACADLHSADFTGADLRDCNFNITTLIGATFARADLRGATFGGAYLRETDFTGADLRGAQLSRVPSKALRHTDITGATFGSLDVDDPRDLLDVKGALGCPYLPQDWWVPALPEDPEHRKLVENLLADWDETLQEAIDTALALHRA